LEPGTQVGRFRVESLLGTGGMGEVYQAWDPTLERSVALKALRAGEERESGAPERFRREALALAQLNHPNVCQVHDWVDGPGGTFIAMELVAGRTLDQAAPELKARAKLEVIRWVALALEAAHTTGLIHRDLKPGNIMVAPGDGAHGPQVKVLDFGLARLADPQEGSLTPPAAPNLALLQALDEAERARAAGSEDTALPKGESRPRVGSGSHSWERLTQVGTFMGSPSYAAPEQIQGQAVGPSSDVFSLGIVAWELLAGEHPFPGEGRTRMRYIVEGSRRDLKLRGLPSGTADLLRAMLEAHPFKRPSAARVAETLGRLLRPHRLRRWTVAAVAGALILGGAGNWFLSRGIITDLVRQHPARLVVLPFMNATGEGGFTGLIRGALPQEVGARLAACPKQQVVRQETLIRPARKLGLNLDEPLDQVTRRRLADYLNAALLLHGEVRQAPNLSFHFVLEDSTGRVRTQGDARPEGSATVALQALPAALVGAMQHAIDPLARTKPTVGEGLNGNALLSYGQGLELMLKGSFKEALPLMRTAALQAPFAAGPVVAYATCLYRTGDAATDAALRWSLSAARLSKDRYREIITLKALALREREQGHLEAAVTAGREGLALAETGGFEAQRVSILNNLGLVLQDQNHLDEAQACFSRAAEVQRKLPDPQGLANSINNLAILARNRGAFPEAESKYREALSIHQTQGNRFGEALAHTNLGDLTLSLRRFKEAKEHLGKADALFQEVGNRTERAVCQINLGVLNQCLTDFEAAEAAFQSARRLAEEAEAPPTAALAWSYLAGLSRQRGRIEEAASRYSTAAARHQALQSDPDWAGSLAGLAECALQRRSPNLPEADRLLKVAAEKARPADPLLLRARWRRALAVGQKELAAQLLDQALEASKRDQPEVCRELETLQSASKRSSVPAAANGSRAAG